MQESSNNEGARGWDVGCMGGSESRVEKGGGGRIKGMGKKKWRAGNKKRERNGGIKRGKRGNRDGKVEGERENEGEIGNDNVTSFISLCVGSVGILNLQDITTQNDLNGRNAVFAFNIHPQHSPNLALGYSVHMQWTPLREEFNSYWYRRSRPLVYFPPESVKNCRRTSNTTLQLVGPGSYELTVPTAELGSGPLSVRISVSFACLDPNPVCTSCYEWRYTSQISSSIDISAKRGRATDCSICTTLMLFAIAQLMVLTFTRSFAYYKYHFNAQAL